MEIQKLNVCQVILAVPKINAKCRSNRKQMLKAKSRCILKNNDVTKDDHDHT